jgi:hypothetical protein
MSIKASELVTLLCEHIKEYGDENVLIYDGYDCIYKTFNLTHISRNNKRFVIECVEED